MRNQLLCGGPNINFMIGEKKKAPQGGRFLLI